ncbi:MAG: hypothetical protein ACRDIC_16330, partial [bacterium]
ATAASAAPGVLTANTVFWQLSPNSSASSALARFFANTSYSFVKELGAGRPKRPAQMGYFRMLKK